LGANLYIRKKWAAAISEKKIIQFNIELAAKEGESGSGEEVFHKPDA